MRRGEHRHPDDCDFGPDGGRANDPWAGIRDLADGIEPDEAEPLDDLCFGSDSGAGSRGSAPWPDDMCGDELRVEKYRRGNSSDASSSEAVEHLLSPDTWSAWDRQLRDMVRSVLATTKAEDNATLAKLLRHWAAAVTGEKEDD